MVPISSPVIVVIFYGCFKKIDTTLTSCHFFVFWPKPFSFSGLGGVVMLFVPWDFSLRSSTMPLTAKQKTKMVALWCETISYIDTHRRFCREYDLRTSDGPTNCAFNVLWNICSSRVQCTTRAGAAVAGQHQLPRIKPTSTPCGILQWTVPRNPTAGAPGSSASNQHQSGISSPRNWSFSHTSSLLGKNWVKTTWERDLICAIGSVAARDRINSYSSHT